MGSNNCEISVLREAQLENLLGDAISDGLVPDPVEVYRSMLRLSESYYAELAAEGDFLNLLKECSSLDSVSLVEVVLNSALKESVEKSTSLVDNVMNNNSFLSQSDVFKKVMSSVVGLCSELILEDGMLRISSSLLPLQQRIKSLDSISSVVGQVAEFNLNGDVPAFVGIDRIDLFDPSIFNGFSR